MLSEDRGRAAMTSPYSQPGHQTTQLCGLLSSHEYSAAQPYIRDDMVKGFALHDILLWCILLFYDISGGDAHEIKQFFFFFIKECMLSSDSDSLSLLNMFNNTQVARRGRASGLQSILSLELEPFS